MGRAWAARQRECQLQHGGFRYGAALAGRVEMFVDRAVETLAQDTVWTYSLAMNRETANLADVQWIAQCANRLREQWPRADPTSLEEAALELWHCDALRSLAPAEAAARWLAPLLGGEPGAGPRDCTHVAAQATGP
jgi:hypothetical protein